ncbi:MAG TPA: hypothetical protein VIO57_10205 [Chloroflexota bacterium]|jgi:hypothetical protein
MADTETTVKFIDGNGAAQTQLSVVTGTGSVAPETALRANGAFVADTNPLPTYDAPHTPAAGTTTQIAVGGTAVVAITGPVRGGYIVNPSAAADQGIGVAESIYVDPVNSPGSAPGAGNGTAMPLVAGQSWTLPCAIPIGATVRVNAASSGHKFTVVIWN